MNSWRRTASRRLLACAALVVVGGILAWLLAVAGDVLVVWNPVPQPEAVIVLASHEWERLPAAADIARRSGARVLLTVPRQPTPQNCHLCSTRAEWVHRLGVPRSRIELLTRRVTNTFDEAVAARDFCERASIGQLLVVTSPYHARRARATFEAVFAGSRTQVGIHPASAYSPAVPRRWWREPYDRSYVAYEWAALAWYLVRHGVAPWPSGHLSGGAVRTAGLRVRPRRSSEAAHGVFVSGWQHRADEGRRPQAVSA